MTGRKLAAGRVVVVVVAGERLRRRRGSSRRLARPARSARGEGDPAPHDGRSANRERRRDSRAKPGRSTAEPRGQPREDGDRGTVQSGRDRQLPVALGRARHHERLGLGGAALRERAVDGVHVVLDPVPHELLPGSRQHPRVTRDVRSHLDVVPVRCRASDPEVDPRPGETGGRGKAGVQLRVLAGDDAAHAAMVDGDALGAQRRRRQQATKPRATTPIRIVTPSAGPREGDGPPPCARRV